MQEFKYYIGKELDLEFLSELRAKLHIDMKVEKEFFAQSSEYPLANIRNIIKRNFIVFTFGCQFDEDRINSFLEIVKMLDKEG